MNENRPLVHCLELAYSFLSAAVRVPCVASYLGWFWLVDVVFDLAVVVASIRSFVRCFECCSDVMCRVSRIVSL